MNKPYDCTEDVKKHIHMVQGRINMFIDKLRLRAAWHDESKLNPPEFEVFNIYTPKLKELDYGSAEYKAALESMGAGLQHHYQMNSHHPEHYENGMAGMDLPDIVEMLCDWMAAAEAKGNTLDLDFQAKRFGIDPQLLSVLKNTIARWESRV